MILNDYVEIRFALIITTVITLLFKIPMGVLTKMTKNIMKSIITLEVAVGVETW